MPKRESRLGPSAAGRAGDSAPGLLTPRGFLRWSGLALLLFAAWNFVPRSAQESDPDPPVRVVLVDASASVRAPRPDWLRWIRELLRSEAESARGAGESFCVVSFAGQVGRSFGPGEPELFLGRLLGRAGEPLDPRAAAGDPAATLLARALETASELALQPGRIPGTVVIAGTERWTDEHPGPVLARLAREGVRVERRAAPARTWHDLSVREVRLPATIEEGAPLLALARVAHVPGAGELQHAALDVSIHNAGLTRSKRIALDLAALGTDFELPIPCGPAGPGRTTIEVRTLLTPGPDAIQENDLGVAATRARGDLLVLVCAESEQLGAARAWLASSTGSRLAGIQFLFSDLAEAAPHFSEVDAVVSYDIPPGRMPRPLVQALLERGGGYLATSGWRFLEDWVPGEMEAGVAALLPGRPAPLDRGPRDVVLLVDGSGSMEGAPFETVRAACLDLVRTALPSDQVSLRFFTSSLLEEHIIKPRTSGPSTEPSAALDPRLARVERAQEAARALLGLHVPSGQTYLFASLESFVQERSPEGPESLVFVLSDGLEREYSADPEARAATLRAECLRRGVEMIPIAIGERAELEFLARLGRPGTTPWRPDGLDSLRDIFRREMSGAQWRGAQELSITWSTAGPDQLATLLRGRTADAALVESLQPLERFVKNEARAWGEVIWEGDEGEPVLLAGRVGLGRSALFAALPGPGWGARWTNLVGLGEPAHFAGILRWLARGATRRTDAPVLTRSGDTLVLGGLGPEWPAMFRVPVIDALDPREQELLSLSFTPSARAAHPNPLGERTAQLPAQLPEQLGQAPCVPLLKLTDPTGSVLWFPWRGAPVPEYHGGGESLLAAWWQRGEAGGGSVELGGASRPGGREGGRESPAPGPLAPLMLGLGLAALFCGFLRLPPRTS